MTEIKVSDYGILPNQECGAEIGRLIEHITRDSSPKTLIFENGTYYINAFNVKKRNLFITNTAGDGEYSKDETPHEAPVALYFDGIKNLTVEGNGAKFLISGKATNCVVKNCESLTLQNFTIDVDKPDFHELKVTRKTAFSVDFELDLREDFEFKHNTLFFKGYGFDIDVKNKCKTAWWTNKVAGENEELNTRVRHPLSTALGLKLIDGKALRAYYLSTKKFKIGDRFYLFDNRRQYAGIFVDESKDITIQNVAQHFNYSLAVVCQCSENIYLKKLDLTPKENLRVTSVADFVQICMCRGEFQVTDCVFDGAGDDTLNCHGFHFKTTSVNGNTARVKFMHPQSHGYNPFRVGDEVAFIDKKSLLEKGRAKVISSCLLDEYTIELELSGDTLFEGLMVENVSASVNLYFARNEIHRIVTRGILVTNRGKTVIENNNFGHCGMSGILISDDASSWYESSMCEDVIIENNTFQYCGDNGVMIKPENQIHEGAIHKNIKVLNNKFVKTKKACFYAKSSKDLTFEGNEIMSSPKEIELKNCENVVTK